jgi:hypothetical protein
LNLLAGERKRDVDGDCIICQGAPSKVAISLEYRRAQQLAAATVLTKLPPKINFRFDIVRIERCLIKGTP